MFLKKTNRRSIAESGKWPRVRPVRDIAEQQDSSRYRFSGHRLLLARLQFPGSWSIEITKASSSFRARQNRYMVNRTRKRAGQRRLIAS